MRISDAAFSLRPGRLPLYPPAEDREAWEGIRPEDRAEILELAERYGGMPWPARKATDFLAFTRTGSRTADEQPYFTRRRKLCAAALGCCADPERSLDQVVDGIWMICEETSWVISAHNVNPIPGAPEARDYPLPDPDRPYVDLFSAQTGMILSFVCALLGRRLDAVSPVIRRRAERAVRERVTGPFMTHDEFWWMGFIRKDLCNWTPWIVSNVLYCACLGGLDDRELETLMRRAAGMLDRYLDCVPADGGCDEGAGYWNMAGGSLLDCLELMEKAAGVSLWGDEKIRNTLAFPLKAEIGGGWFMNFADCDARPFLSGERIRLAGEKLGMPELEKMGRRYRGTVGDQLADVPHLSRALSLLFHPEEKESAGETGGTEGPAGAPADRDVWLPDLQVRLAEREGLAFCCKGGRNAGSHAHCDTGSFMLYDRGEPEIIDAGNMIYTAKTFSGERHTLWNIRSGYHNLPVFGGAEQGYGPEFAAEDPRPSPEGISMELARAWPKEAGLRSFRRSWELTGRGLRVRDEITLERETETAWIFMLRREPEIRAGEILFGTLSLALPEGMRAEKEEIRLEDARMLRNWPEGRLWRLRIAAAPGTEYRVCWEFVRREKA